MEDIQSLLEKINREGIEKAEAEAKVITENAKAEAAKIIAEAKAEAAKAKAEAEKTAADYASRAAETIRESARDIVIGVKESVSSILNKLLEQDVTKVLGDAQTAVKLVESAVTELTGAGEIICGKELAKALAAEAAKLGSFKVVTDENSGAGFKVTIEGGRIEHSFTVETISAFLASRLRPDLAALLK